MLDVRACALPPTKSVGASLNRPHIDCLFPVIATGTQAVSARIRFWRRAPYRSYSYD